MAMIGVPLCTYKEELRKIPNGVLPTRTIDRLEERLTPYAEELAWRALGYKEFDPYRHCHAFPEEFYDTCTFEERVKIYLTSFIQLPRTLDKLFDEDPSYRIMRKLRSSLWRWGYCSSETEWNNIVDAYDGIRSFSFGLPDFSVTLDHTTGYNEFGCGEHDRSTYLDGVFGLRVHYHGEHVMTIGFSIASGRKLLLSQIQLKKEKGNRFLFKLPMGRVPYVVSLMKQYFPGFRQYLVDGDSSVAKYLKDFRTALQRSIERRQRYGTDVSQWNEGNIAYCQEHLNLLEGGAGERIRRTYQLQGGPYRLSTHRPVCIHTLRFHRIVRA